MSYPDKIKLTKAGEAVALKITKCAKAAVGKFPGVEFTGALGTGAIVTIEVPQASADRQLGRIPLTYAEAVGCTLVIGRDPNPADPSKPYWSITLPGPRTTSAKPNPLPPDDPAPHPAEREGKAEPTPRDLYLSITKDTLAHVVPLYTAEKIPVDAATVAAIVAVRYIQAHKH